MKTVEYSPRVTTAKLLTQVRDQQPECLKNKRMPALGIILNSLVEDPINSLIAVVCALLLHWMGNPVCDSIGCRHDSVLERENCQWLSNAMWAERASNCLRKKYGIACRDDRAWYKPCPQTKAYSPLLVARRRAYAHRRRITMSCLMTLAKIEVESSRFPEASRSAGGWRQRSPKVNFPSADSTIFGERGAALRLALW